MKQKDMKNTEVEQENVETVTEEQKEQVQTIYIVEKTKYVQPIQPNSHGDLIIKKEDSVRVSCPKCGLRMKIKYDNKAYRVFASIDHNDGRLLKCDGVRNPAKFANTPDHCFIENGDIRNMLIPSKLDRQYYIDLAKKRLEDFGVLFVRGDLKWT